MGRNRFRVPPRPPSARVCARTSQRTLPAERASGMSRLARIREPIRNESADLMRARHRLSKLLLRRYGGGLEAKARRDRLDQAIAEIAAAPPEARYLPRRRARPDRRLARVALVRTDGTIDWYCARF